ncbi:MAG TPA: hypothetical protein VFR24_04505 [Candidatus Angelobacter sp.]|nr:hypothetical protein [Candidatus Angelobacter sp.]
MENKTGSVAQPVTTNDGATGRRKRRNNGDVTLRYFLPKTGPSSGAVELGQEVASEGEALIEAFKHGQQFYTVAVWKAVPEVNGGGSPVIVKQPATQK